MFGGVGEEFGDGEVGGGFDGVGGAAVEVDGDGDGEVVGEGEGVDGSVESSFDEDGWVDAADEVAEFGEGVAGGFAGFGEHGAGGVGVLFDDLFGHAEMHAEGDESGLGSVVEVAFDASDFGGLGVDGVGAAGGEVGDAGGESGFFGGGEEEAVEAEVDVEGGWEEEEPEGEEEGGGGEEDELVGECGGGVGVVEGVAGEAEGEEELVEGVAYEGAGDGDEGDVGCSGDEPEEVFPGAGVGDDRGSAAGEASWGDGAVGGGDGAFGEEVAEGAALAVGEGA